MKQSVGSLDRPLLRSSLATMAADLVAVIVVVAAAAPRVASAAEARARAGADGGTATRAPSAARGRQLFMTVGCVHCHGSAGQGSNSGTRLAPDPLPAEAIATFIRAPNTQMPAYSAAVLSDADVADIAAFLRTVPAAKPADEIPALRALK